MTGSERTTPPRTLQFAYERRTIDAKTGDSLLTALVAAGETSLSRDGARGFFCNMGVCQECRVVIDGRQGTRACMTTVSPGMRVTYEDS